MSYRSLRRTERILGIGPLTAALVLLAAACSVPAPVGVAQPQAGALPAGADLVQRGEYLVTIGGCHDCHTPWIMGPNGPEPDMTRALSGHPEDLQIGPQMPIPAEAGIWAWAPHNTAWVTGNGVAYAFNLTPDENTGIGVWTEEMFIKTLRTGKHWGVARDILPPMPWFNYGKMTDEDLKAVWAYLRSIPPVHNRVPDAVVASPPAAQATGAS